MELVLHALEELVAVSTIGLLLSQEILQRHNLTKEA